MPYAIRDKDGNLLGTAKNESGSTSEFIAENNPELLQMQATRENAAKVEVEIQHQIRAIAIKQMKADAKIDADYKEPAVADVSKRLGA